MGASASLPGQHSMDGMSSCRPADLDLGAYVAADVAAAVSYLRVRAVHEKIAGICAEAAAILPKAGAELG